MVMVNTDIQDLSDGHTWRRAAIRIVKRFRTTQIQYRACWTVALVAVKVIKAARVAKMPRLASPKIDGRVVHSSPLPDHVELGRQT